MYQSSDVQRMAIRHKNIYNEVLNRHFLRLIPSLPLHSVSLTVCLCLGICSSASTHTLTITCICYYDEIKGTQDLEICSHAHSQILSHCVSLPAVSCILLAVTLILLAVTFGCCNAKLACCNAKLACCHAKLACCHAKLACRHAKSACCNFCLL